MSNQYQNPNLIVKNGVFLSIRLLLVLFLAFFTTRLTLQILGDENYGIYNIVGGIVALFNIISLPIRDSLQRFFNVEFANNRIAPNKVFGTSVRIVLLMVLVMTILYETIGLYLINNVIKYPEDNRQIVNIIFQVSALANIFAFISLPYLSLLLSKENMGIPAIFEIVGAILRILLLVIIPYIPMEVLIPYSCIFLIVNFSLFVFYRFYCKRKYVSYIANHSVDLSLKKNMFSFSGWSFIEAIAGITLTYISNIFINIFGGIFYNTAYGISKQLQQALSSFTLNVLKAADPQITSGTATNNDSYRNQLVMTTAKISFLGVSLAYIFFHFKGQLLLGLWLEDVPKYTFEFCDIMLLSTVFTSISAPFRTLIMATGNIKRYFVLYGIVSTIIMMAMYFFLKYGYPVIVVLYMLLLSSCVLFVIAIIGSMKYSSITLSMIIKNLVPSILSVALIRFFFYFLSNNLANTIAGLFESIIISLLLFLPICYFIAFNKVERKQIKITVKKIFNK